MSEPSDGLRGRAAIVVGLDAIGAGIASRLEREGLRVARVGDLDDPGAVAAAVTRAASTLGGLHTLIVNVLPMPTIAPLESQGDAEFAAALGRVRSAAAAMRAALPALMAGGGGRIVVVGHRYGDGANDALAAYNTAAWGLRGLVRTAAVDWGQHQVTTNLLLPFADTPEYRDYRARKPALLDLLAAQVPLARAGDAVDDIGGAVLMLVGATGAFVNGEVLHADGGMHVAGPVLVPGRFRR